MLDRTAAASLWASYVPHHLARELAVDPSRAALSREHRFNVVALFVDVSGFTAMSEALGKFSRVGDEEISSILGDYFGPMTEIAMSYGGDIAKFAGDGMSILFPYTSRTSTTVPLRAVSCALQMQKEMERYQTIRTSAGTYRLAIKVGVAMGRVLSLTVGDPAVRLEYVVAGNVLDQAAEAEQRAEAGEVMVQENVLTCCGDALDFLPVEGGRFGKLRGVTRRPAKAPLKTVHLSDEAIAVLSGYLHPMIVERLRGGHVGLVNEHRSAIVMFVGFDSGDFDSTPGVGTVLQRYFASVLEILQRYEAYLYQIEMVEKGSKYIVAFGAPVAHENDDQRALECGLQLAALPEFPVRIGVSAGRVYCGQIGGKRRTYALVGDTVNVAARIMLMAKPGQILVSGMRYRDALSRFVFEPLAPLELKGKSEPVAIDVVRNTGRTAAPDGVSNTTHTLPMVGRQTEVERARYRIDLALEGRGQLIGVTGDAGIGKSRLGAEISTLASLQGFKVYRGTCVSHGQTARYLVWQEIWRTFFDLTDSSPTELWASRLRDQLASMGPQLVARLGLLSPLINTHLPESEVTRTLDAKMRSRSLRSLVLECLRHRTQTTPLLLVLEDCHWIDPLSMELLEFVGRNLADIPAAVLLTYRPLPEDRNPLRRIVRFGHTVELRLDSLTPTEGEDLAANKLAQLGIDDPEPKLIQRVLSQGEGNPFYIEELVNLVYRRGAAFGHRRAGQELYLPDSLTTLAIARIDQIPEDQKTTLKVASIIGRPFRNSWLRGIYPQIGTPETVQEQLAALEKLDLIVSQKSGSDPVYAFKHAVTQEAAYNSLTFASRQKLHEFAGEFLERHHANEMSDHLDVLAHHFGRSGSSPKQALYFRLAGDAAKASNANEAAVQYYQRLLAVLPPQEQSGVLVDLGEIWQLVGELADAEEAFSRALDLARSESERAECLRRIGSLLSAKEIFEDSLAWLNQALEQFDELKDDSGLSRTLESLSHAYIGIGDYSRALECAERHFQIASASKHALGISTAAESLGRIYFDRGDHERALSKLEHSLEIADEIGHQLMIVAACNDMAGVYSDLGDGARAISCLKRALDAATKVGYQWGVGIVIGNAGRLYFRLGDTERAEACLARELEVLLELGNWRSIVNNLGEFAYLRDIQGDRNKAQHLFDQAISLGRALKTPYFLCDILHRQADLCFRQRRFKTAQALVGEALEIATALGDEDVMFRAGLLSLRLEATLQQQHEKVRAALESRLQRCIEDVDCAALHYELWRLDEGREASRLMAADLYRTLYEKMPDITYRRRYEELTGEFLTEPSRLQPLPEISPVDVSDLEQLWDRAIEMAASVARGRAPELGSRDRNGQLGE